ncbi:MAG TPA: hypothetical protein VKV04_02565 [Verrucomicrobiae bacterium]|nr:hypothetical protein [Verrucomicrobiae bacterium]
MYPQQILEAVSQVYAACATYLDSGQVTTRFIYPDDCSPRISVRPFTTAFHRPDRFRFEFRSRFKAKDPWQRYIVWADGELVRTWWDIKRGVQEPASVALALAGATGVSGGSAHTIPDLLMPDRVGGRRLTELAELMSLGDETLGGGDCCRLSGRFPPIPIDPAEEEKRIQETIALVGRRPERAEHSPLRLWIDRSTLLIRRIEETKQFETFRSEETTDYEPAVGVSLSDAELQFGAP